MAKRAQRAWRIGAVMVSIGGIAAIPFFRNLVDDDRIGLWVACAVPLLIGLAAMIVPMEIRSRILFLWFASLLASFVAMITFMSGFGIVMAVIVLAYLVVAWGLNEAGAEPGDYDRGR
jgi:hypothetical protein